MIILLVVIITLHIFATYTGMYDNCQDSCDAWIDNVIHIIAGFLSAMLGLWFLQTWRKKLYEHKFLQFISIVGVVLLIALTWELFEFYFLKFLPKYAYQFALYSPSIAESLEDVLSNLMGGIFFVLVNYATENFPRNSQEQI